MQKFGLLSLTRAIHMSIQKSGWFSNRKGITNEITPSTRDVDQECQYIWPSLKRSGFYLGTQVQHLAPVAKDLCLVGQGQLMSPCSVLGNWPCALFNGHNRLLLIMLALSFCRTECIRKRRENICSCTQHAHAWHSFAGELLA